MMNRKKAPPRALLTLIFTIVVFIILVVTMIIVGCVIFFLTQIGVLGISQTASAPIHFQIIIFAMTSIVIGTIVAALGSHFPLRPLKMYFFRSLKVQSLHKSDFQEYQY